MKNTLTAFAGLFVSVAFAAPGLLNCATPQEKMVAAARCGDLNKIKQALKRGISVNARVGRRGRTALLNAARIGRWDIVRFLINKGANVNMSSRDSVTAIMSASGLRAEELERYQKRGCNAALPGVLTPFERKNIVRERSHRIVRFLVRRGADFSIRDRFGNTALHYASRAGNYKTARHLLKKGANINNRNKKRETPLHLAVRAARLKLVKFLLENGANPKLHDAAGKTPLRIAREKKLFKIIILLEKAASREVWT